MEGEKRKILSFWQDKRVKRICHMLTDAGYAVGIAGCTLPAGMPRGVTLCPDWREALKSAEIVLLPLPMLRNGGRIAFSEEEIPFSEFLGLLPKGTVLLCGMPEKDDAEAARRAGMTVCDYYDAETVKQRNAVLTAEGAVSIAMQELPLSLDECRAAVVGCGRIGNALCKILRALNVKVTALSRRKESLLYAESLGCKGVLLSKSSLKELMQGYDVVFTTVPHRIFDAEVLSRAQMLPCGRNTLFIDLSSSPGSFDAAAAREYGVRLLWALSLPGKYAPDSAGAVLAEQMLLLLKETNREGTI